MIRGDFMERGANYPDGRKLFRVIRSQRRSAGGLRYAWDAEELERIQYWKDQNWRKSLSTVCRKIRRENMVGIPERMLE